MGFWWQALRDALEEPATWTAMLILVAFLASLGASLHALLYKRRPYSAALWIVVCWSLPVLGPLLYWGFGINRVARKARKRQRTLQNAASSRELPIPQDLLPLVRVGDVVARHPLVTGNRFTLLVDGDQAYPEMLRTIEQATHSLGLLSYIFDDDPVSERFVEALRDAARRGVQVRLLVDGIGAWGLGPRLQRTLEATGGRVASFWPRGRYLKHPGINLRNHRKILVADGRLGFTGGINISARHVTRPDGSPPRSRDVHFRVEGPVVSQLAQVFADDWEMATGEVLKGNRWFPPLRPAGAMIARGIASGPDRTLGRLHSLLLGAIRTARASVDILSPYLIPDEVILEALRTASRAGIRVRVLLPRRADHLFLSWAAQSYLPELVEAGVEVYQVPREFLHGKLTIVDDSWVLLGSANLDARSFRLNFEFNVEVHSPELARDCLSYLAGWRDRAIRVSRRSLRQVPTGIQLRNHFVKLFSPFL